MRLSEANRFRIPYGPMPPFLRAVTVARPAPWPAAVALAAALAGLHPGRAAAQASPYLPLDDPRLPLLEHLIERGDLDDPSPMVRPFRRADARRVLDQADSAGVGPLVVTLRAGLEETPGGQTWRVAGRAGGQAFSHIRRDVLHPLGTDGARPYADFTGEAVFGPIALVSRLAAEPRIVDDPEWPGRHDLTLAWRFPQAYLSAQFAYGSVFYGQMERNWGPVGLAGIGVSNYGYPQVEAGLTLGTRTLQLEALARSLYDADSLGQRVHRYFFAHRLSARLSRRLQLGLWETTVLAGVDRAFDGRYRNPLTLLLLGNQYGLGPDGNVMLGLDAHWRVRGRATLQAQLGLDDLSYEKVTATQGYPNRWAFTVTAFGPLGRALSWRALYTQASSLAFRTSNPFENFTDAGVGLGRNFDDMDQASLTVGVPVLARWLVTPELTLLRQGEGDLNDPFPATDLEAVATPSLFIGVVERTWRAAVDLRGGAGPLELRLNAGLHHVVNQAHVEGRTVNRFEGRLQATLGLGRQGVLR
jgi:hypothetical protein